MLTASLQDPLLPLLPVVADEGYVVVVDGSRSAAGIITAADITHEFGSLAEPFFLVGEIERRLRDLLRGLDIDKRQLEELDDGSTRRLQSVSDLALGQIERLLENPITGLG